jgi:MFS family permease
MSSSLQPDFEAFKPGWKLLAAFWSIAIVNLACALDATTISVEAFWIGTSFLLASAVWQPNFIAFSHVFGRKPLLILALVLFTIGAILCGVSMGITLMLVGRCIQGIGVGGTMTLTQTLITDMIPLRQRGNYFALIAIMWAIGSVSGPLVGGVLAQVGAWRYIPTGFGRKLLILSIRWIFYLNLPIVAIGFVGVIAFLDLEQNDKSLRERFSEIDYFGTFLFVGSTTSFLIPITWGGVMFSWSVNFQPFTFKSK